MKPARLRAPKFRQWNKATALLAPQSIFYIVSMLKHAYTPPTCSIGNWRLYVHRPLNFVVGRDNKPAMPRIRSLFSAPPILVHRVTAIPAIAYFTTHRLSPDGSGGTTIFFPKTFSYNPLSNILPSLSEWNWPVSALMLMWTLDSAPIWKWMKVSAVRIAVWY